MLITHSGRPAIVFLFSVRVRSLLLPHRHLNSRAFGLEVPGCKFYIGEGLITEKERKKKDHELICT